MKLRSVPHSRNIYHLSLGSNKAGKAAPAEAGSHGRSSLVSLGQYFPDTEKQNRTKTDVSPPFVYLQSRKITHCFCRCWHIGEYNFVINNYVLPKDNSRKTDEKHRRALSELELLKTANDSAAILTSPWLFAKAAEPTLTSSLNGQQNGAQLCMLQPPCQSFEVLLHPTDIQLDDFQSLLDTAKPKGCL